MDDSDEALRKFGRAVLDMIHHYNVAAQTGDRAAVQNFQLHMVLVEALAQVAVLKVVHVNVQPADPAQEGNRS